MVGGEFKSGPVDVEKVVNDNINTFYKYNVRYSIQPGGFVGFEPVDGVINLLSQEETEAGDGCGIVEVWWNRGGGGKKELAKSLALSELDMAKVETPLVVDLRAGMQVVFTSQVRSGHLPKSAMTVTGQMTADSKNP